MRILIIILIIFTSCQNKQEVKSNKIPYQPNDNSNKNAGNENIANSFFLKIPDNLQNCKSSAKSGLI